jgi:hypothetical protein
VFESVRALVDVRFYHRITDRVLNRIRSGLWFIMNEVYTCTGHRSGEQYTQVQEYTFINGPISGEKNGCLQAL